MSRKRLPRWLFVLALALLLLTLCSCDVPYVGEEDDSSAAVRDANATGTARIQATRAVETVTAAAAIAGLQTVEARRTAEAEATRRAATGPALEITEMWTEVIKDNPEEGIADIDFYFTVRYMTGGDTAFVVCYEENVESEETLVSAESGTSRVVVHLVDFDYYGPGQADPFCELRDAVSREMLAEAHPGPATVYLE